MLIIFQHRILEQSGRITWIRYPDSIIPLQTERFRPTASPIDANTQDIICYKMQIPQGDPAMMRNNCPEKRIQRGSLNTQWSNLNRFKCQYRSHIPPQRNVPPNRKNASASYSTFTSDLLDFWERYIQAPPVLTVALHLTYGEPC